MADEISNILVDDSGVKTRWNVDVTRCHWRASVSQTVTLFTLTIQEITLYMKELRRVLRIH